MRARTTSLLIAATGDLDGRRFIFTDRKDQMGILTVKAGAGDDLQVDGKITP